MKIDCQFSKKVISDHEPKVELIKGVNESGFSIAFERTTCKICGVFLGDTPVTLVNWSV